MTVKNRILLVCILWSIVLVVSGSVIFLSQERQLNAQRRIEQSRKTVQLLNDLHQIMLNMEKGIYGYLISGEEVYLEPFSSAEGQFDAKGREALEFFQNYQEQRQFVEAIVQAKNNWISGPVMDDMLARKKYSRKMISYEEFLKGFKDSKSKEITTNIDRTVTEAKAVEEEIILQFEEVQKSASVFVRMSVLLGMSGSILIGFILILFTLSGVNSRITSLIEYLGSTADQITSSSKDLSVLSQNLNYATNQVSSAVAEASETIAKINTSTVANTSAAAQSIQVSESCIRSADAGQLSMSNLRDAIESVEASNNEVESKVKESNSKLLGITKIIQEIHSKTNIINDIVFQTKLLSFNASVEAARAGDHGKGFSVVAEEVGKLAALSGSASEDISHLLDTSTAQINKIIRETTESLETLLTRVHLKINDSKSKAIETDQALHEIKKFVDDMRTVVQTISTSSSDQASRITEITSATAHIQSMMVNNQETSEKYSKASVSLEGFAETLGDEIVSLREMFLDKSKNTKGDV